MPLGHPSVSSCWLCDRVEGANALVQLSGEELATFAAEQSGAGSPSGNAALIHHGAVAG
jgi:hypothetical protein